MKIIRQLFMLSALLLGFIELKMMKLHLSMKSHSKSHAKSHAKSHSKSHLKNNGLCDTVDKKLITIKSIIAAAKGVDLIGTDKYDGCKENLGNDDEAINSAWEIISADNVKFEDPTLKQQFLNALENAYPKLKADNSEYNCRETFEKQFEINEISRKKIIEKINNCKHVVIGGKQRMITAFIGPHRYSDGGNVFNDNLLPNLNPGTKTK